MALLWSLFKDINPKPVLWLRYFVNQLLIFTGWEYAFS